MSAGDYVFAISGLALIVTAITAPEGITGLVRSAVGRIRPRTPTPPSAPEAVAA